ncbi:MAG TPA: MFS transporter [Nocardioides sp.]|nr:MFS transporter [Nocardioides sp.]
MRSPAPKPARGAVTFVVLAVSITVFTLLQSLVVPVMSTFESEYDTDQATVTWMLTGYLLTASIATPLLGRVGDVVGKTRMLTVTLLILSLGSLLAAIAPNIGWLIFARVVQGAGGGVMPLAFGIARDEFRERMSTALAVLASLGAVGFGFGIVLAGPIVDAFGHQGLFWIPMVATLAAAVATILFVPPSPVRTPGRLPILPAVLLAAWLAALLLAISKGNAWGWGSPRVLGLLVAAAVFASLWVWIEMRVPVPMIDMQMMRVRGVWSANAVAGFVGFGMFASFGFLPQFLQTPQAAGYGFGATITESGHMMLPSAVASFLVGFGTASLVHRLGARSVILAGTLTTAAAYASLALWHTETWQVYAATIVQGLGSGLVFASLAGVVIAAVPPEQTGVASGMNANIRTIGGSLGSAAMAGIVTAQLGAAGFPVERGYTIGFAMLAIAMVAAAVASLGIPNLHEQATGSRLADADNAELGFVPAAAAPDRR